MRNRIQGLSVALALAMLCGMAQAQSGPGDRGGAGQQGQGGPGGPGGPGGFGPGGGIRMNRDRLGEAVAVLADANLSVGFNLSDEQKQKVQNIRDAFRKEQDAWRSAHAEDLKAIDDQMAQLRDGGGAPDPGQMQEIMEARRQLMSTAPDGATAAEQLKALLTPDQLKVFEEKEKQLQEERDRNRQMGGQDRGGNRRRGR